MRIDQRSDRAADPSASRAGACPASRPAVSEEDDDDEAATVRAAARPADAEQEEELTRRPQGAKEEEEASPSLRFHDDLLL